MKRIQAVVVIGLFSISTAFAYDWSTNPGDGSASNPYQISTAEQLTSIGSDAVLLTKSYILMNDIDLTGQVFTRAVIAPDTNNTKSGFQGVEFAGKFDGDWHIISNLNINTTSGSYIGLFGYVSGRIEDLDLEDVNVTGYEMVGGLCGKNNNVIEYCYVTGTVTGQSAWVGGLCGYNDDTISESHAVAAVIGGGEIGGLCGCNAGTINKSYAAGTVTAEDNNAGGLCGCNDSGTINQSYATSMVTGKEEVGGLCGLNFLNSTISQSYATNMVAGKEEVGGLCGLNFLNSTISQSYATGAVTGEKNIGGLCGGNVGTITDCFWDMESSGQPASDGGWGLTSAQMRHAASFIGWCGTWIINEGVDTPHLYWEDYFGEFFWEDYPECTYEGRGTEDNPYQIFNAADLICLSRRTPDWDGYFMLMRDIDLGGTSFTQAIIAGGGGTFTGVFNGNNHVITNLSINNPPQNYLGFFGQIGSGGQVKNLGLIDVNITGHFAIGGMCGSVLVGAITSCFVTGAITGSYSGGLCGINEGTISQCYATGTVVGDNTIGGLCGECFGSGTVSQCYAAEMLTGNSNIGGLCGYQLGISVKIENCFWDTELSGLAAGYNQDSYYPGTITNVVGKTTIEMQTLSTFTDAGWDFTDIWSICEGTNYPRLQWQIPDGDFACPDGVNTEDMNYLAGLWLIDGCTSDNNYCGGADIDNSGSVDLTDWAIFASQWLEGI